MSSSHRVLERLPVRIFEQLAKSDDDTAAFCPGVLLQQRIGNKLKSFARKISSGRTKQVCIQNVGEFLKIPEIDLVYGFDPLLTFAECRELRRRICDYCQAKPVSALTLLRQGQSTTTHMPAAVTIHNNNNTIPSGIPALDALLKGGFRVGSVTEIYGSAGTGKTLLGMQICLAAVAAGRTAVLMETEGKFSCDRWHELALLRSSGLTREEYLALVPTLGRSRQRQAMERPPVKARVLETLSRVLLYSTDTVEELRNALSAVEIEACARSDDGVPIGLVVLDSIAAPAIRDFGKGVAVNKAQFLMECAKTLKRLAQDLHLAVVVINQIGSSVAQDKSQDDDKILQAGGALGNSWHHCATTRLLIECKQPPDSTNTGRLREITVTKSSLLKRGSVALWLEADGFKDAPHAFDPNMEY